MVTLFLSGLTLWLGAYLCNRRPLHGRFLLQIALLWLVAAGMALDSLVRADFALHPLWGVVSIIALSSGLWLAYQEARAKGDAFWIPLLRAFDGAALTAVLFGLQIAIFAGALPNVPSVAVFALLYGVTAAAILTQTLSGRVQTFFDAFAFAFLPVLTRQRMQQTRSELREAMDEVPKAPPPMTALAALDEAGFARLTRRALSSMTDLPKLAISPLIELPIIEQRLSERGARRDALERTVELKRLLIEMIVRLKPESEAAFGTTSEWRHYNALYFPYVAGIKPYTRLNGEAEALAPEQRQALDWFQQQVPERTLYNWQGAAARLIAQELRQQVISQN
jgi:hypothetical protein